jgi:hypothetical protein
MKTFSDFVNTLPAQVNEGIVTESNDNVIHLKPHGKDGLKFKAMHDVGPKDEPHIKKGEIIHDHHLDDLADSGYEVKIHEETEQLDESETGNLKRAVTMHASDITNHVANMTRADGGRSSTMNLKLLALHNDLAVLKKKHGIVD